MKRNLNNPSQIEYKKFKFLICAAPHQDNIQDFVTIFEENNVGVVFRLCEPTYDRHVFEKIGIPVIDIPFADGSVPNGEIIDDWLDQVKIYQSLGKTICVHCRAGLGRSPVLVALSLIEKGMKKFEAIELIRKARPGAFNHHQLDFLKKYKLRKKSKKCCFI